MKNKTVCGHYPNFATNLCVECYRKTPEYLKRRYEYVRTEKYKAKQREYNKRKRIAKKEEKNTEKVMSL